MNLTFFLTLTRLLLVLSIERQRDRQVHHNCLVRRQKHKSSDVKWRQEMTARERQVEDFRGVVFAGDFKLHEQNASIGSVDENIRNFDAGFAWVNDLVAGEGNI